MTSCSRRRWGRGGILGKPRQVDITIQMADALAHAHKHGLIHRDVKPKNIILTPQGVAKLTDLGLARAVDDSALAEAEAGRAYGTPYYISPEQIRGDVDIDFRADVYSLGATMYHLVTGRPPFEGDSPTAVMHKHLKSPLKPPDHINTALSAGCREKSSKYRWRKIAKSSYARTEDMLEDLRAVERQSADACPEDGRSGCAWVRLKRPGRRWILRRRDAGDVACGISRCL